MPCLFPFPLSAKTGSAYALFLPIAGRLDWLCYFLTRYL